MENILELDKQRYSGGGVPRFLQFYRKAQMSKNPFLHKISPIFFCKIKIEDNSIFSIDIKNQCDKLVYAGTVHK